MGDKILGVVCLALSAVCQVLIGHADTAMFFSVVFFVLGAYEFFAGDQFCHRQRREKAEALSKERG